MMLETYDASIWTAVCFNARQPAQGRRIPPSSGHVQTSPSEGRHTFWKGSFLAAGTYITGSFLVSFWEGLQEILATIMKSPPLIWKEEHEWHKSSTYNSLGFTWIKTLRLRLLRQIDGSHQYDDGNGASKAPQQFVIDGDPTEVWVPVPLWVQAHGQACGEDGDSQIWQEKLHSSASAPETPSGGQQQGVIIHDRKAQRRDRSSAH